jgi:hypothetical protein
LKESLAKFAAATLTKRKGLIGIKTAEALRKSMGGSRRKERLQSDEGKTSGAKVEGGTGFKPAARVAGEYQRTGWETASGL